MSRRISIIDDDQSMQWLLHKRSEVTVGKANLTTGGPDGRQPQELRVYDALLPGVTMLRIHGLHGHAMQKCALHVLPSIIALNRTASAAWMGGSNALVKNFNCASPSSITNTV